MIEVSVNYLGGVKFDVVARGHHAICDQPRENGGSDAGMTPPEFLLASLATCGAFYAAQYLNARNLPSADLKVHVGAEKATQPARLGSFTLDVTVPGLDARHREGMLRAVKSCLIHNTLLGAPTIAIEIHSPALAHA